MAHPNPSSFPSLGSFALAVRRAAETQDPDRRLTAAAAPTTTSQEGVGSDGGYLVPPDLRREVTSALLSEAGLLARTDRQTSTSNSFVVPTDATPPWATTGPTVTAEQEGALLGQAKAALQSRTLRLTKLQTLLPVSNELFEDGGPALGAYLRNTVASRLDFKVTDYLINGDGVQKPLGILSTPCKIMQTKEGAQGAGTITFANVQKMWSRLYSPSKSRAVWVVHSDAEAQLQGLTAPTGAPALVYPPDAATGYLFGRPVLVTEAAPALGTEGDISLVDPMSILTVTREGAVREDFSIHVWWDLDVSAFRFTMRLAAAQWLSAPLARYRGGSTISTVVTLESR